MPVVRMPRLALLPDHPAAAHKRKILRTRLGEAVRIAEAYGTVAARYRFRLHAGPEPVDRARPARRALVPLYAVARVVVANCIFRGADLVQRRHFQPRRLRNERSGLSGKVEPGIRKAFEEFIHAKERRKDLLSYGLIERKNYACPFDCKNSELRITLKGYKALNVYEPMYYFGTMGAHDYMNQDFIGK